MRAADAARLARVLALLGSDYEGERASAALAADRMMKRLGLSWADLIAQASPAPRRPPPTPDALEAAQSRLRQSLRENADLRRQLTRLKRRLDDLQPRRPPPAEEE